MKLLAVLRAIAIACALWPALAGIQHPLEAALVAAIPAIFMPETTTAFGVPVGPSFFLWCATAVVVNATCRSNRWSEFLGFSLASIIGFGLIPSGDSTLLKDELHLLSLLSAANWAITLWDWDLPTVATRAEIQHVNTGAGQQHERRDPPTTETN